jgi:Zn-dependent protease/predicted transcriptional regulator
MTGGFRLFEVFGFEIKIDPSWFIIFFLIAWSLATGWFPQQDADLGSMTYWVMGFAGALLLFVSVVAHELSHSLVARRYGMPMRGITLFLFGGVAEMTKEPPSARSEFMVAVAGPVASVGVAIACWLIGRVAAFPQTVTAVLEYLAIINLVLVGFNLLPAFPLDGGRVLRSVLWEMKGDLRWATRWSSRIGRGFGAGFIVLGVLQIFAGNFVGGMWMGLIGLFLRNAATAAYQQLQVRSVLEGEPVRRFMNTDVVTVPRSASIAELVDEYVYRYHHKMFPVVDDGELLGCITTQQITEVPRQEWDRQTVGSVVDGCSENNTIDADADAMQALTRMKSSGNSRLMVVSSDAGLEGVIVLKDLLELLELKAELEEAA